MFLHPLVLAPVGLGRFSRLDCSKNFMRHGIQLQALNGTYTGRRERQRNTQPLFLTSTAGCLHAGKFQNCLRPRPRAICQVNATQWCTKSCCLILEPLTFTAVALRCLGFSMLVYFLAQKPHFLEYMTLSLNIGAWIITNTVPLGSPVLDYTCKLYVSPRALFYLLKPLPYQNHEGLYVETRSR